MSSVKCGTTAFALFLAGFSLATAQSSKTQSLQPQPIGATTRAQERWADRTIKRLTLEEKIGQMIEVRGIMGYYNADEEKDQWDALEWDEEDGEIPDAVSAAAINQWLFNMDTVDKVLKHLMERGQKVAGGDRLGKTIIFAKKHEHAEFIVKRFDENYAQYAGHFARVIDFKVEYAQSLIDSFSHPEKQPHIAVSVDMLDTGIDVPEVVNLVFFNQVRSKTKFWQMVGRGTRLRPDLFGPGRDKKFFYIFDFCRNLEFFSQNPETTEGSLAESLSAKLFANRVDLIAVLDRLKSGQPDAEEKLRAELAERLRNEVAGMNLDNFLVRPKRRLVEQFVDSEAWKDLSPEEQTQLKEQIAGLPSSIASANLEAKQFDLLMLRMQLTLLRGEPGFEDMKEKVIEIARLLEEQTAIPAVAAKLPLIQEVQTTLFWEDVTIVCLEDVRRGLRELVQFIERRRRSNDYRFRRRDWRGSHRRSAGRINWCGSRKSAKRRSFSCGSMRTIQRYTNCDSMNRLLTKTMLLWKRSFLQRDPLTKRSKWPKRKRTDLVCLSGPLLAWIGRLQRMPWRTS
jgi:type I site-specific restriction endonuclease